MRTLSAILLIAIADGSAAAQPYSLAPQTPPMVVVAQQPQVRGNLGGGFIEFLFGDNHARAAAPPPVIYSDPAQLQSASLGTDPAVDPMLEPQGYPVDPQFLRQRVNYQGSEAPGTIVIDTLQHFLYLVEPGGKAMRYGIGVGRPGFTWSGIHTVSSKKEWPDWVPPKEMIVRQPGLPHFMAGAPTIRSAPVRFISARRSTESTDRMSHGPSATTSRPAASACATLTLSISTSG